MAAKTVYVATSLTGGGAGALDAIGGAALLDGDIALVIYSGKLYVYILDADSAAAESSPDIIAPDTGAGDKRWLLQAYNAGAGVVTASAIKFPATQVASTDLNTLDDYEEGTFTPTLLFGGAAVGMAGSFSASYTKIGRIVNFLIMITLTAKGSSSGTATISGFPTGVQSLSVTPVSVYINGVTFANMLDCFVSVDTITLREVTEDGTISNLTQADFLDTSQIHIAGTFRV